MPQNLLQLDVLFITETWLNANDLTPLGELCPPHCGFLNAHRASGRGGGLDTIFNNNTFKCRFLPTIAYSSFEVQLLLLNVHLPILCALVDRPPKTTGSLSINEFTDLLSSMASRSDKLLIVGDFNIHICCPTKHSQCLVQPIKGAIP